MCDGTNACWEMDHALYEQHSNNKEEVRPGGQVLVLEDRLFHRVEVPLSEVVWRWGMDFVQF